MRSVLIGMFLLVLLTGACTTGLTQTPVQTERPFLATQVEAATPTNSLLPAETPAPSRIPSDTPEPTLTATLPVYGPEFFPANVNPLTGLPVDDPGILIRRPVAVKVQIFPRGQRPPWGISLADIVFDYYQNDGLTRLNAVFYSQDAEQVGPVRSARLFDDAIIRMYKAVFAFGGGARPVLDRLLNADYYDRLVLERNNNCPPMCRVDPNGYNYLFTNTAELSQYITGLGVANDRQPLNGMTFDSRAPAAGQLASQVFTRFSISAYTRWDFDPDSGRYLRFQDVQEDNSGQGEAYAPLMDGLTGRQIAADNVVILFAGHTFPDPSGNRRVVDIELSGEGPAYAFRDGQVFQVQWRRPAPDSPVSLVFEDGSTYALKPGNTWFEVIGKSSQVLPQENGAWRFNFNIP